MREKKKNGGRGGGREENKNGLVVVNKYWLISERIKKGFVGKIQS